MGLVSNIIAPCRQFAMQLLPLPSLSGALHSILLFWPARSLGTTDQRGAPSCSFWQLQAISGRPVLLLQAGCVDRMCFQKHLERTPRGLRQVVKLPWRNKRAKGSTSLQAVHKSVKLSQSWHPPVTKTLVIALGDVASLLRTMSQILSTIRSPKPFLCQESRNPACTLGLPPSNQLRVPFGYLDCQNCIHTILISRSVAKLVAACPSL